ncbi:hypothetical protein ACIBG0_09825 [Nocardia sp. NPDC050630]|uniref:hypothetical protein n=1 Tax=Nocardia sp. NPDC050630 TaxID=3364321 RepID=UPI003787F732
MDSRSPSAPSRRPKSGVPVAAVTVGAELHVLVPGEASAMMLGALCTIAAAALAASRIATVGAHTR